MSQTNEPAPLESDVYRRSNEMASLGSTGEVELRYRQLVECAPDAYIVSDPTTTFILDVNEAACASLGYTRSELLKLSVPDISLDLDHTAVRRIWDDVRKGEPISFETTRRRKDGTTFPVEVRVGVTGSGPGRLMLGLARDITRRKRAEQERDVIAKIGRIINSSLNIADIYSRFVDAVHEILESDRTVIADIDVDRHTFTPVYIDGVDVQGSGDGLEHKLDKTPLGSLVDTRKPLLLDRRLTADLAKKYPGFAARASVGLHSHLMVPLISNDEVIGMFTISSTKDSCYDERDLSLAQRVGAQISGAVANSRLYATTQSDLMEKEVLAEMGRVIGESLDIREVYERFARSLKTPFDYDRITISEFDAESNTLTPTYVAGLAVDGWGAGTVHPLDESQLGPILDERTPILIDSRSVARHHKKYGPAAAGAAAGLKSGIAVPLIVRDRVVGAVNLSSFDQDAYSEDDLKLLERVGLQIANAISNARLFEQSKMEARDRRVIAEIGKDVSSSLDIYEVCRRLDHQLRSVLTYDRFVIVELDPVLRTLVPVYQSGLSLPSRDASEQQRSTEMEWRFFSEQTGITRLDRSQMEEHAVSISAVRHRLDAGLYSHVSMPIVADGAVLARLGISSSQDNAYTDSDADLLSRIAAQVAPAFTNSQLYQQTVRLGKQQAAIAAIGATTGSTLEIDEVYGEVATQLQELIPFDHLAISTVDRERNELVRNYVTGLSVPGWEPGRSLPLAEFSKESVVFTGISRLTSLTETGRVADPNPAEAAARAFGLLSQMVVPLSSGGEIIGVMSLRSKSAAIYTSSDLEIAQRIAEQLAPAMANASEHEALLRLTASFEQAQHALDSTADMVAIHDSDTKYIYVNDAFVAGTGFHRDDIIGHLAGIQDSDLTRKNGNDIWDTVRTEGQWSGTFAALRKDGTRYHEQATITPIFDSDGEISSFVVIKRDVTDRIEAEVLISQSGARQDLISTVEHELRSPLAAVINFVDLLRKSEERRPEVIEALKTSAIELAGTIDGLRRVNLDSATQFTIEKRPENISLLLTNSIARASLLVEKKKLHLNVSISNDPMVVELEVDASRITQVFSNLITNAVRYTPDSNNIDISLDRSGRFTRFRIYNEGTGIAAGELDMVTHPFFRGASSSNSTEMGSGIGPALSGVIVQAHSGYMSIRSEPEKFFEVEVLLPNPSLG